MTHKRNAPAGKARGESEKAAKLSSSDSSSYSTATQAQRARIVEVLRRGPHTSYELRQIGCYQAPARILELRRAGYEIRTQLVNLWDRDGYEHKNCALYHLEDEPEGRP